MKKITLAPSGIPKVAHKITRRINRKTPKKWVKIVSNILKDVYGENICYRETHKKIIIYAPRAKVHECIHAIIKKIEGVIQDNENTDQRFLPEDDISVVFEDGVSLPCEWKIVQIVKLKSACSITYGSKMPIAS